MPSARRYAGWSAVRDQGQRQELCQEGLDVVCDLLGRGVELVRKVGDEVILVPLRRRAAREPDRLLDRYRQPDRSGGRPRLR
jgi:hypothetical protein